MSDQQSNGQWAALQIVSELNRVRQRANARLGSGIDMRAVRMMMAKLDGPSSRGSVSRRTTKRQ